ncbi:MAG: hypothetical protein ACLFWD_07690 [Anaerolineales bacterium]
MQRSKDPELAALYDDLSERRERVAALELELFEARSDLAAFEVKVERRLGSLQDRVEQLEKELKQARRQAARRAQWGDRVDRGEVPYDVLEQFERTWRRSAPPAADIKEKKLDKSSREEIKLLYRRLAKRFHPDLTVDPEEKKYREGVMAQVNEAYAQGNLARLHKLSEMPDRPMPEVERTREQVIVDLRAEIRRLDGVIHQLRSSLDRLTRSSEVQLMLEASMAERQGRDLVAEMASDLRQQIAEMEAELAELT